MDNMKRLCTNIILMLLGICLIGCSAEEKKEQNVPSTNEITQEPSNDETNLGNESQESLEKEVFSVDAMFLNGVITYSDDTGAFKKTPYEEIAGRYCTSMNSDGDYSQVVSAYNIDKDDDEQLCAFVVRVGKKSVGYLRIPKQEEDESEIDYTYRKIGYYEDVLRQRGIYILEDYPYCLKYKVSRGLEDFLDEEYYNVYAYGCIGPSFAVVGTMKDIVELCKDCEMVDGWYFQFLPAPRPDLVEVAREAGDYVFWDYQGFMWSRMEVLGEEESIITTVEVS